MSLDIRDYIDQLSRLCAEQVTHARHHEVMRAQSTNYLIAGSVALLGILAADKVFTYSWEMQGRFAVTLLIVALNVYGIFLSRKHAERARVHANVATEYRQKISRSFEAAGFESPEILRNAGWNKTAKEYPITHRTSLHMLWLLLHILFSAMAVILFVSEWLAACGWQYGGS